VVGIEKVLPSWRDLEVFLALLPRSSTAERMNPYTSTWTGITPGDGPENFHLVLLDNGRTSALADRTGRSAQDAIELSEALARRVAPTPVRLADERLTTVSAERSLRAAGVRAREQRAVIDQAAAVAILQSWLDQRRTTMAGAESAAGDATDG